ncbi:MAG: hypothetical protein KBS61_07125 [Chryseobacterium sp.]|nr:hypothetical protein [Candidatus Chryseobacterium enterohippi]
MLYSLLIFASANFFAQKNPNVKFVICNDAVGTVPVFNANKAFVQSSTVFKSKTALPSNLKKFDFLADNGLTESKFKKDYGTLDIMNLSTLNEQYGLPKDTPVYIEGYEFSNTETTIFAEILAKIEVKQMDGKKVLFVTTPSK